MHPLLRVLLWMGGAALLLPVAFILTILSFPFWRWIDMTFQIEAFGHSGPAEWCYWSVYMLCLVVAGTVVWIRRPWSKEPKSSV